MIADPCNCTLVPGLYGSSEGLLSRSKRSIANGTNTNSGYVLWCPQFHNLPHAQDGHFPNTGNLFVWCSDTPSQPPKNSGLDTGEFPFGYGKNFEDCELYNTASAIQDPTGELLKSDLVMDARVLSSCIKMTYTGRMDAASGEVAYIENLSLDALIQGGSNAYQPACVNDLFQHSAKVTRLGIDTMEIVGRLDTSSDHPQFHGSGDSALYIPTEGKEPTSVTQIAETLGPKVYGFVWRGLDTQGGTLNVPLSFAFIKNIEWKAEPNSGFTQVPPKSMSSRNVIHDVHKVLDAKEPHWATKVHDVGGSIGSQFAKVALTGVTSAAASFGSTLLEDLVLAPLALI